MVITRSEAEHAQSEAGAQTTRRKSTRHTGSSLKGNTSKEKDGFAVPAVPKKKAAPAAVDSMSTTHALNELGSNNATSHTEVTMELEDFEEIRMMQNVGGGLPRTPDEKDSSRGKGASTKPRTVASIGQNDEAASNTLHIPGVVGIEYSSGEILQNTMTQEHLLTTTIPSAMPRRTSSVKQGEKGDKQQKSAEKEQANVATRRSTDGSTHSSIMPMNLTQHEKQTEDEEVVEVHVDSPRTTSSKKPEKEATKKKQTFNKWPQEAVENAESIEALFPPKHKETLPSGEMATYVKRLGGSLYLFAKNLHQYSNAEKWWPLTNNKYYWGTRTDFGYFCEVYNSTDRDSKENAKLMYTLEEANRREMQAASRGKQAKEPTVVTMQAEEAENQEQNGKASSGKGSRKSASEKSNASGGKQQKDGAANNGDNGSNQGGSRRGSDKRSKKGSGASDAGSGSSASSKASSTKTVTSKASSLKSQQIKDHLESLNASCQEAMRRGVTVIKGDEQATRILRGMIEKRRMEADLREKDADLEAQRMKLAEATHQLEEKAASRAESTTTSIRRRLENLEMDRDAKVTAETLAKKVARTHRERDTAVGPKRVTIGDPGLGVVEETGEAVVTTISGDQTNMEQEPEVIEVATVSKKKVQQSSANLVTPKATTSTSRPRTILTPGTTMHQRSKEAIEADITRVLEKARDVQQKEEEHKVTVQAAQECGVDVPINVQPDNDSKKKGLNNIYKQLRQELEETTRTVGNPEGETLFHSTPRTVEKKGNPPAFNATSRSIIMGTVQPEGPVFPPNRLWNEGTVVMDEGVNVLGNPLWQDTSQHPVMRQENLFQDEYTGGQTHWSGDRMMANGGGGSGDPSDPFVVVKNTARFSRNAKGQKRVMFKNKEIIGRIAKLTNSSTIFDLYNFQRQWGQAQADSEWDDESVKGYLHMTMSGPLQSEYMIVSTNGLTLQQCFSTISGLLGYTFANIFNLKAQFFGYKQPKGMSITKFAEGLRLRWVAQITSGQEAETPQTRQELNLAFINNARPAIARAMKLEPKEVTEDWNKLVRRAMQIENTEKEFKEDVKREQPKSGRAQSVMEAMNAVNERILSITQEQHNTQERVSESNTVEKAKKDLPGNPQIQRNKGGCFNCGETGHWSKECTKPKKERKEYKPNGNGKCPTPQSAEDKKRAKCDYCSRINHNAQECRMRGQDEYFLTHGKLPPRAEYGGLNARKPMQQRPMYQKNQFQKQNTQQQNQNRMSNQQNQVYTELVAAVMKTLDNKGNQKGDEAITSKDETTPKTASAQASSSSSEEVELSDDAEEPKGATAESKSDFQTRPHQ